MKKREGYKIIISEPAKSRLERNECPACGKPKSEWTRRKDWRCCSENCTSKYYEMWVAYGWQDIRMRALKRDNFTCVKCGTHPTKVLERYESETDENWKWRMEKYNSKEFIKYLGNDKGQLHNPSQLIGDHIVPIALGGEEFGLDNVQTLCIECNKIKTAGDIKDISIARKLDLSQTQIV